MTSLDSHSDMETTVGAMLTEAYSNKVHTEKKRSIDEIASPSQKNESEKSRQKLAKDPAPILYFDVKTEHCTRDAITILLKKANIYGHVKEFRITSNGNLLIFPLNLSSKNSILNCDQFLHGVIKLDLAEEDKGPMLMIKGSSFTELQNYEDELKCYGISKIFCIINVKNKGKELNLVKALMRDSDKKTELLNQKTIYINKLRHYVEDVAKHPIQCGICKKFGHKDSDCTSKLICSHCALHHSSSIDCTNKQARCTNCQQNHSSFYRGCIIYQQLKKELNLSKANPTEIYKRLANQGPATQPQATIPTTHQSSYSDALKKDVILEKLEKLSQEQTENFKKQASGFEEFKKDIHDLNSKVGNIESGLAEVNLKTDKKIADNNKSVFNFVFENLKAASIKIDQKNLKPISDRFTTYNNLLASGALNDQSNLVSENRRISMPAQAPSINQANPFSHTSKW